MCEDKDEKFEEDKNRDDIDSDSNSESDSESDSDSDTMSCYHYGGVFSGGVLKVIRNVPELSSCQVRHCGASVLNLMDFFLSFCCV